MNNDKMNENEELTNVVIDFTEMKAEDGTVNESWLVTFGLALRWIMPALFRGASIPVSIKGNPSDVKNFANVLSKEKRYMSSWKSNGLDSPITYKNKSKLNSAIAKFERSTGLKWPFK
jgi:hypothetical protein